jgi:hypothetical protein
MAAEIKRCRDPFAIEVDGITRVVAAGELVSTEDPAYSKATRGHFEDVAVHVGQQTERRAAAGGGQPPTVPEPPGAEPNGSDLTGAPEPFDPSAHNAPEVHAYLADADEEERMRVLAAEAAGKNRKGILGDGPAPTE